MKTKSNGIYVAFAVCVYALISLVKAKFALTQNYYEILQILLFLKKFLFLRCLRENITLLE